VTPGLAATPARPKVARGWVLGAWLLLVIGLAVLVVAVVARVGAQQALAEAEDTAAMAEQRLDEARGQTAAAVESGNAAAAGAAQAQRDRDRAASDLAASAETIRSADPAGRLATADEIVRLSREQADRFAGMNAAALADDAAGFNRLANQSNTFVQRVNALWDQLIDDLPGITPPSPVV